MFLAFAFAFASARALAAENTVITVEIEETHDRLEPDPRTGIVADHAYVVTLSPNGSISETRTDSRGGGRGGGHRHGGKKVLDYSEDQAALGSETSKVAWHVLGPHQLQRIGAGRNNYIIVWDLEIGADNQCSIEVKYVAQKGFDYVSRVYNGAPAKFSLPRVLGANCLIN